MIHSSLHRNIAPTKSTIQVPLVVLVSLLLLLFFDSYHQVHRYGVPPVVIMALSSSSSSMMLSTSSAFVGLKTSASSSSSLLELTKIKSKQQQLSLLSSTTGSSVLTLSGGSTDDDNNKNNDANAIEENPSKEKEEYVKLVSDTDSPSLSIANSPSSNIGMTIALASTYCTVMAAKCALPSVLSLLLSSTIGLTFTSSSSQQQMAQLLRLTTIGIVFGKVLLGPVIDNIGGKRSLYIALSTLCICLLTISIICQSFVLFSVLWIIIDFTFSACWPACIHTIYEYFPSDDNVWSTQIGYIAAAARAGNTIAFTLFAGILYIFQHTPMITMKQYWRPVFFVAGIIQLMPILLLSIYGKNNNGTTGTVPLIQNDPTSKVATLTVTMDSTVPDGDACETNSSKIVPMRSTLFSSFNTLLSSYRTIISREMIRCDFWLHMINRSMLMILASFLLFVPTLMSSVYSMSTTSSAQVGSLYAMGCLLSVTIISKYYAKMSKRTKLWCITILLLVGSMGSSFMQWAHVSGYVQISPLLSSILLFVWGFSFAIPFYIPPSLYALSRGGKELSATITDCFDIGAFALLAIFNGYVASVNHTQISAWVPTFGITTICALTSYISLFIATWRE